MLICRIIFMESLAGHLALASLAYRPEKIFDADARFSGCMADKYVYLSFLKTRI